MKLLSIVIPCYNSDRLVDGGSGEYKRRERCRGCHEHHGNDSFHCLILLKMLYKLLNASV